jgi:polysaccharide biosynthesis protein PslJ
VTASRPALPRLLPGRAPGAVWARPGADAVSLLSCYVLALMLIPSSLVVGSLGAAGAPAGLFAIVLLGWFLLARWHPGLGLDRGPQPMRIAGIMFGCAILASYVSINRTAMATLAENGADRGIIAVCGWLGVLLLAADGIGRDARLTVLLRRIVLGASVLSVLAMVEFLTGSNLAHYVTIPGLSVQPQPTDLMNRDGLVRAMATTAEPLELAAVLAMSLPLAIHLARTGPARRRARRWLQAGLITAALPLTGSRSAFLALAAVALVLLPSWSRRDRWRAGLILLAAPAVAWLADPGLLGSFGSLFGQLGSDQSTRSRTGAWAAAAPFIAHHPWFGQGLGTFFPQVYFFVDDQYLTSMIETGVVGTLALLGLFATGWFLARSARRVADPAGRDLAQSLSASVVAAAVAFASLDVLSFSIATGLFFLLLGCTGAAWRLACDGPGRLAG